MAPHTPRLDLLSGSLPQHDSGAALSAGGSGNVPRVRLPKAALLLLALAALLPPPLPAAETSRPNIVFLLSDDHAAQAIGCYGGKLMKTPNLDRIASAGMRFDRCFCTESICAPSRATLLTGKYGHITGATGWKPYDRRHRTFPEFLRDAGYQTALVGKYHLGNDPPGFDYFDIFPGQGRHRDPQLVSKEGTKLHRGHSSDVITDLALAWLERRDRERPFLLCLHDKSTHMPWQPAERFAKLFENETLPEPPTLFDDYSGRADWLKSSICRVDGINRWQERTWGAPPVGLSREEECRWLYQTYMRHYLRCAAGLDENVGRVLDWLDRNQLAQDTIVVYSSDQGFFLGEHGWFDKRWMQEESLRMPLIVRYPRLVKPGSVASALVLNTDFAPTLLDLAGVAAPAGIQGRSLRPILAGETPPGWRKAIYYRYYTEEYGIPPQLGIRTDRYKLIHYKGRVGIGFPPKADANPEHWRDVDEWELFDLQSDPDERVNLSNRPEAQKTVMELKMELQRLRKELGDPE